MINILNRGWIAGLMILCAAQLFAQVPKDTLYPNIVLFEEIQFSYKWEDSFFRDSTKKWTPKEYLNIVSRTQDTTERNLWPKLRPLIDEAKLLNIPKNKAKYIKNIYHLIHGNLLKKYEARISFEKIFTTGEYNCVTASALYAMVFEEMGIPYQLKELPNHVYIVAYPDEQIVVESTNPRSDFFQFDLSTKTRFVNELVERKLISTDELATRSIHDLFNEYYFKDKVIDMRKLIALQYFNQGLFAIDANNFDLGLRELEKACYLYPSRTCVASMLVAMLNIIEASDYSKDRDVMLLVRLSRLDPAFGVSQNDIYNQFAYITQKLLIDKGKKERYESVYEQLMDDIESDSLKNRIEYVYNYEIGRYHILRGNQSESKPYAIKALKHEPTNVECQAMVMESYRKDLMSLQYQQTIDSTTIKEFLSLKDTLPVLWENGNYRTMYVNLFAAMGGLYIDQKNYSKALSYLENIDALMMETDERPVQNLVSQYCGEVAKHYFKRGDYKNARKAVGIGLGMYPNDSYLKMIKDQLR